MAIGHQLGAGNEPVANDDQCALHMAPKSGLFSPIFSFRMKERHDLVKQGSVFRGDQVLRQCQQRPEHDVAVGIACPDVPLPVEEHKPLGPIAVRVLSLEEKEQDFPDGRMATQPQ